MYDGYHTCEIEDAIKSKMAEFDYPYTEFQKFLEYIRAYEPTKK